MSIIPVNCEISIKRGRKENSISDERISKRRKYDTSFQTTAKTLFSGSPKTQQLEFKFRNCTVTDESLEELLTYEGAKCLELTACQFSGSSIAGVLVTLLGRGLEKLVLSGSEITGEHLRYVADNMHEHSKLKDLDVSHIALDETGAKAVSKIKSKAGGLEWLNLHDCELDEKLLEKISEADEGYRKSVRAMKTLTLSSNPDIWDNVTLVTNLINQFGCEEVDISANSLGSAHITELARITSVQGKVKTLHVCENPINDWKSLGDLVRNWRVKNVGASECRMYREDCHEFATSLEDYQLDELNLYHPDRSVKFAEETRKLLEGTAKCLKI